MGYKRSTLKLEFDGEFEGLEIKARRFSMGEYLLLAQLSARMQGGDGEAIDEISRLLNQKIIRWNLEEDVFDEEGEPTGEVRPIPKNAASVAGQDRSFITAIISGIVAGSVRVPTPLETPSGDGDRVLEASIPMEIPLSSP